MRVSLVSEFRAIILALLIASVECLYISHLAKCRSVNIPGLSSVSRAIITTRNRQLILSDTSSESEGNVNAYPDSRRKVAELKIKVDSNLSKDVMNVAMLKESVRDMEQESSQPGFWDSQEKAQELLTEMNRVKALVERVEYWQTSIEDVDLLLDMASEDPDEAREWHSTVLKCYVNSF
jgi:PCRF domain